MSDTTTPIRSFVGGTPTWTGWKGVFGLVLLGAFLFFVWWFMFALGELPLGTNAPLGRAPTDGAFGFSAQEWKHAFSSTWTKALMLLGLLLLSCLVGSGIGILWRRFLRKAPT